MSDRYPRVAGAVPGGSRRSALQVLALAALHFHVDACAGDVATEAIPNSQPTPALERALPAPQPACDLLIGVSPQAASRHAIEVIRSVQGDPDLRGRYRQVVLFGDGLFPSDDELMQFDVSRSAPTSALFRWLKLPSDARRFDLWLRPDEDYFWASDLRPDGRPVDFSAEFIVHFSAQGPSTTCIEIVQFHSRARYGKRLDLLGRAGPGRYWDIQPASPSGRADADLRELLARGFSSADQQRRPQQDQRGGP